MLKRFVCVLKQAPDRPLCISVAALAGWAWLVAAQIPTFISLLVDPLNPVLLCRVPFSSHTTHISIPLPPATAALHWREGTMPCEVITNISFELLDTVPQLPIDPISLSLSRFLPLPVLLLFHLVTRIRQFNFIQNGFHRTIKRKLIYMGCRSMIMFSTLEFISVSYRLQ